MLSPTHCLTFPIVIGALLLQCLVDCVPRFYLLPDSVNFEDARDSCVSTNGSLFELSHDTTVVAFWEFAESKRITLFSGLVVILRVQQMQCMLRLFKISIFSPDVSLVPERYWLGIVPTKTSDSRPQHWFTG